MPPTKRVARQCTGQRLTEADLVILSSLGVQRVDHDWSRAKCLCGGEQVIECLIYIVPHAWRKTCLYGCGASVHGLSHHVLLKVGVLGL
jgi:hypothetical protein